MIKYDYSYIINDISSAVDICKTAISQGDDGSLVMLIIDGINITIRDLVFGENVAIVISEGSDKIFFDSCYFKYSVAELENNGTRVVFNQCSFEGMDTVIKSTGYEIFISCSFRYTGNEAAIISAFRNENILSRLNYTIIMDSDVYIENREAFVFITEGDASVTVINMRIHSDGGYVSWTKDMVNENTFSYYNCPGISGVNECGYEIDRRYLSIYSLINIIGGADKWMPLETYGESINLKETAFYINTNKNISFVAGKETARIALYYYPCEKEPMFTIKTLGSLKAVQEECGKGYISFSVTGENNNEEPEYGFISFETREGIKTECVVEIKPSIIEPPRFLETPEIIIKDGRAAISYELDLDGREDLSEISWYRVDNIDRTKLSAIMGFARSNEKDCRKIAVSRGKPCKEIQLTHYDVGKHIKVNIKPRHIRSESGAGLNIISRIIMESDIKSENIIINMEKQVMNPYYKAESGYGTVTGIWLYKKLPMCRYYDMVTETNDCGYYFASDIPKENMTVYIILDFENNKGEGFGGKGEYQEIYIKYDVGTKTGYGIRYECKDIERHIAGITLYKYDGLMAQPISETITGSFLKSGMDIKADIYKNAFTVQILMPDIDEPLKLSSKIDGNSYSGMGIKHQAVSTENNRIGIRYIEMSFPD